jgi:methyl-accepting chemotaxis protein
MQVIAMLAQADRRGVEVLERIATAQVIIAVSILLLVLFALGGMVLLLLEYRSARRLIRTGAEMVTDLKPRLAPLIDRATHLTADLEAMADNVRRKMDDVLHTVEDLRRAIQRGGEATEERVRRFAAVMDVVQSEAENLLLDATATARGVHETARALHEPRPALRRPRTAREERDE